MSRQPIAPEQLQRAKKILRIIGTLVVVFLVANFVYQLWFRHYYLPKRLPVRENCDLRIKACTVFLPDDRAVRFSIDPKPFDLTKPLVFTVHLDNMAPQDVSVLVMSLDKKGPVRHLKLPKTPEGDYAREVKLGSHHAPQERWVSIIHVIEPEKMVAIPFHFNTGEALNGAKESGQ